jgi:hypothetical protein
LHSATPSFLKNFLKNKGWLNFMQDVSHFITTNQNHPSTSFRFVCIKSKDRIQLGFHGCDAPYKKGELKRHYEQVKKEWETLNPTMIILEEEEREEYLVYSWKRGRRQ